MGATTCRRSSVPSIAPSMSTCSTPSPMTPSMTRGSVTVSRVSPRQPGEADDDSTKVKADRDGAARAPQREDPLNPRTQSGASLVALPTPWACRRSHTTQRSGRLVPKVAGRTRGSTATRDPDSLRHSRRTSCVRRSPARSAGSVAWLRNSRSMKTRCTSLCAPRNRERLLPDLVRDQFTFVDDGSAHAPARPVAVTNGRSNNFT